MSSLPSGWQTAPLGVVAEQVTKGTTPTTNGFEFQRAGISFIRVENIFDGKIDISTVTDFISDEAHQAQRRSQLKAGDILFSIAGTIGETAIVEDAHLPANTNQALAIISGFDVILSPKFLEYQLKSFVSREMQLRARGGAMNNISLGDLKELKVVIPPAKEQVRIVAKIEELYSELDKGIETLTAARAQLKVYRHALLKHAFEGRLTEKWRSENGDKLETSETLSARIRLGWKMRELNDSTNVKRTKINATALTDLQISLPPLPRGWLWVPLELVAEAIDPQPSHRTPPKLDQGIPYVGVGDITKATGTFDFESARKVSNAVLEEHKQRYDISYGDFIIGKIGTIGKPFRIPIERFYALSANVVLVRPNANVIDPDFLLALTDSPVVEAQFKEGANATTQAAFGIKKVRLLCIPVCSPHEQRALTSILSGLLESIVRLETEISSSLDKIAALRLSILTSAFSGRLVAQDLGDATATVLLDRLRSEWDDRVQKPKKSKRLPEEKPHEHGQRTDSQ